MDDTSVLSFELADVETTGDVDQGGGRAPGVTVNGVGSIVHSWKKEVKDGANSATSFVVVQHDVNNNTVDKITVTYVFSENTILMPHWVDFGVGNKLWVVGRLELAGQGSDGRHMASTSVRLNETCMNWFKCLKLD
ncbi:uncharacterized protein PGTG_12007 [Puccinia graminis f. sp. tritici CRL 75-36-700-3]|uniref:Uncharacterized protein n=1 Tax=Puccinia graminis f. sp. tritici (strain CRL 75-36-700-3 / race SCCL) TaxID=418459 RepID=E3KP26_PUCGT|nr:uncharacterized protein PGTG_12007 [Puccinia graminis f. sp. tritici CRL 75-36-700-3]EFP86051.2 hypothetical protein PGTG_12007 [Puccinia graminis f. sp. tritici CRL 75-36-700-3]